jgi:hypothetical protein
MSVAAHAGHENPHAGQGSVLLDIGGDIGALVVAMPASMLGQEIEIDGVEVVHPHGHTHGHGHAHRAHVAVVDRPVPGGTQPSLVFPELSEGSYALYAKGAHEVLLTAEITGGQVTFVEWPTP